MFAIPAGIWFATAQMKVIGEPSNYLFTKNFIVLMTVLCMVLIMVLNIWGQRSTITQMNDEYTKVFEALEAKFEEEKTNIKIVKGDVDKRHKKIMTNISISIIVCIALAIYTAVLFYQSI